MRSASPLIAAGLALAVAGQALAAAPKTPAGGQTDPGMSSPPATSTEAPATTPSAAAPTTAAPSDQSTAPSAGSAGSNSSATAGGSAKTAPASFTVGETVKDSTGVSIGTISSLTGAGDQQMAVIKMGDQSFQVQASKLGSENGAAEINMTKAQIAGMLKGK
jgi:hypothetical protein